MLHAHNITFCRDQDEFVVQFVWIFFTAHRRASARRVRGLEHEGDKGDEQDPFNLRTEVRVMEHSSCVAHVVLALPFKQISNASSAAHVLQYND
jgi:hypothetical protein